MDNFELDMHSDGSSDNNPQGLPDINAGAGDKEKASNLFTAMANAIDEEKAKQADTNLNAIDRVWESRRQATDTHKQSDSEYSDSFDMDAEPKVDMNLELDEYDEDDDEFGIAGANEGHNFKKVANNNISSYLNDPNLTEKERKEYQDRLNQLKTQKSNHKKNNNIKSDVIVEDEDEESSEAENENAASAKNKGKINQIFDDTIGEYKNQQKNIEKLMKQKEVKDLAKIDIMKAEASKNKILSSVGKFFT